MKHILLTWFIIFCSVITLSWCSNTWIDNSWVTNVNTDSTNVDTNSNNEDKEIISILEKFSKKLNISQAIAQGNISRNDIGNRENQYDINWYIITWKNLKIDSTNWIEKIFDWWHVEYIWDNMFWSFVEYSNEDIFCYYSLGLEQEPPYELIVWEDKDGNAINYDEEREKFNKTATYTAELSCWRVPWWVLRLKDFNINAEGQEPFWFAPIRWWKVALIIPDWISYYYPTTINYSGDIINFSWYNVSWELVKSDCVDLWKWDTHKYHINMDITNNNNEETHYEWCADDVELNFSIWEEWTLENFIKKSNYNYEKPYKIENVSYVISDIINDYMEVDFYIENDWENNFQLIMERTDEWWIELFEWTWYEISDDECERLNQYDNNLMEMFFLTLCPRG